MTIMDVRNDDNNNVKMWEYISPIHATTSFSSSLSQETMAKGHKKSDLSHFGIRGTSQFFCSSKWNLTVLLFLIISLFMSQYQVAGDSVYVRSGDFGQLVTSSTLRWFKGIAKDPLMLKKPNGGTGVICRVFHTTLRGVGLVSEEAEGSICNINTPEGAQGSDKFQTISESASRLIWTKWNRPNKPPTGAVVISVKPQKFLAADLNSSVIGYLDPTLFLGSAMFPNEAEPATTCLVLTEIEPVRYEMSDVQLKRNKGFIEEDIVLAYGKLIYEDPSTSEWDSTPGDKSTELKSESNNLEDLKRGRVESILSYETNSYDYWSTGYLMAKGLHTTIHLPDGTTKIIEWGIPLTQAGKTETMTAVADLLPGTGINVTLHGTRLNGEMSYWATLKTFFKDGSTSTRLTDNHRKVIEIQDIRLEHSKPYFLSNYSIVPEPTTTTTTTTTTPSPPTTVSSYEDEGTEEGNALPVESSHNNIQADQSLHLTADNMKSQAKSVNLRHWSSSLLGVGFAFFYRFIFAGVPSNNFF